MIYGAGISGLVAAIHLAQSGSRVLVYEKRAAIGGPQQWHPSVHQQTFNLERTSKYIGIDLSPCFQRTRSHTYYLYGRKYSDINLENNYICVKGAYSDSIENYLYEVALEHGVEFSFERCLDAKSIAKQHQGSEAIIAATGLESQLYRELGIRHMNVRGYRAAARVQEVPYAISCIGLFTNHEFAYVACSRKLRFALLFSRTTVAKQALEDFQKHLLQSEGLAFDQWRFSKGAVPVEKQLVKNGIILAGTLSGMIDPFYLNGISGALVSGRLAAEYCLNPKHALIEFNRFTKYFYLKRLLRRILTVVPSCRYTLLPILLTNNYFKTVGVV